jgi:RNA polymerase sigma-70 factor (ECF subfamily)
MENPPELGKILGPTPLTEWRLRRIRLGGSTPRPLARRLQPAEHGFFSGNGYISGCYNRGTSILKRWGVAVATEVTRWLRRWSDGDPEALDQLVPLVDAELRRLAKDYLQGERQDHTLQTTALVNEAFIRLIDWKSVSWQNRAHFFGVSAQLMRHILVDMARARRSRKRGGGRSRVTLDEALLAGQPTVDVVEVDDVLRSLGAMDPRKGRIVELRFFGGLDTKETAEVLGLSTRSVEREWNLARAWLLRELERTGRGAR